MKRFPRASYLRDQLHRLFVTAMLALAALALLGKAAHAQASCGDITDQPDAVYEDMVGVLGEFFPIEDARVCDKVVKAGAESLAGDAHGACDGGFEEALGNACLVAFPM